MPRREREIDPAEGPVVEFAFQLRRLKNKAGTTYRAMAEETHFSHAHLVRAARGDVLPSWPVTKAYLQACGVISAEALEAWEQYWAATDAVAARPTSKRRRGLDGITTVAEFGAHLQQFSNRHRRRTLRELEGFTFIGRTTINDWFQGRRLPSTGLLRQFALGMGATPQEIEQLQAARLRLSRGGAYGSELARTLAAVLRAEEDTPIGKAAREVSVALVKAEGRRIGRSMMYNAHETGHSIPRGHRAPIKVMPVRRPKTQAIEAAESEHAASAGPMKGEATKAKGGAEHARATDPVDLPRLLEDRAELTRVVEDHVVEDRGERTRVAYEAERLRAARLMGEIIAPAALARHLGAETVDDEIEGALRSLLEHEPGSLAKILAMAEAADRIITEQRAGGEQQQEGPRPG